MIPNKMNDFKLLCLLFLLTVFNAVGQCPVVAPVPNNACYQTVIANDSWCCNNSWDGLCQSAYDACAPSGGGSPTSGDCFGSIAICTDNTNFSVDPNGYGTVNELCTYCTSNPGSNPASGNMGCLLSGELNSTWFSITITNPGTLAFSFGTPGLTNCYDWAMWPYNPSACNQIAANSLAPIRCNWNGSCNSFTGVGPVPPGGNANNFEPVLNVVAGQQFMICFSNYSSAFTTVPLDFYGTASVACITLSVELTSFEATNMRAYNLIEWSTASEVNNSHFELERSTDGVEFVQIATIEGNGSTTSESNYEYKDYFISSDLTYYRLNQVDFNGEVTQSNIVVANAAPVDEFKILTIYPNPSSELFKLHLTQPMAGEVEVSISEYSGRKIYAESVFVPEGNTALIFPVGDYSNGFYVVSILNKETGEMDEMKVSVSK